jgi:hypothetical protein
MICFANREMSAIRVMKHQCADAGLGIHPLAFRELHADSRDSNMPGSKSCNTYLNTSRKQFRDDHYS